MTDQTYNKTKNFIHKHHMIESHDLVAIGVSGGADSVCLLHILHRLLKEIPYRLVAVHVDHSVRAQSADDAAYVERLCKGMEIPFYLEKVDMNGYAEKHGLSSEEAGRLLRYKAFEKILRQQRQGEEVCKVAVAHNANDRAETMLFHLFRGTGLKGLASIQPVRESVIRPLLCLERKEIEEYLAKWKLDYCQDSTNEEDLYTRNKIRHHILPYAGQEICSRAVEHMGNLADMLSETERYLEKQTKRLYDIYVEEVFLRELDSNKQGLGQSVSEISVKSEKPEYLRIQGTQLLMEDPVMYSRVLLACMERLAPHRKDITGQHIADLVTLIHREGSKELSLPYGIQAYKEYDKLILGQSPKREAGRMGGTKPVKTTYKIVPPMKIPVPNEGIYEFTLLEKKSVSCEKQQNIAENGYTKWFDYDKITTTLLLRTRQQGDYLTIDTALHTKSVKQYMINEKIPKILRDSMYILADGAHILWIPGYRISQRYKVDESTKRILQVQLRGGFHGGTN